MIRSLISIYEEDILRSVIATISVLWAVAASLFVVYLINSADPVYVLIEPGGTPVANVTKKLKHTKKLPQKTEIAISENFLIKFINICESYDARVIGERLKSTCGFMFSRSYIRTNIKAIQRLKDQVIRQKIVRISEVQKIEMLSINEFKAQLKVTEVKKGKVSTTIESYSYFLAPSKPSLNNPFGVKIHAIKAHRI